MRPVTTRLRFASAALAAALGCSLQHPAVETDVPRDLDDVSSDPTARPDADVPVADDVLDVPDAPDADVPVALDADVPVDEPVAPDADVPVTPDADVPVALDADVPVAPDADVPVALDADVPVAPDADVPVALDADVPVAPDAVDVTPPRDACSDFSCALVSCASLPAGSLSGVYTLRAIGGGTWRGYCDVPNDGSAPWTLVMKVDGARTTFRYDADHWYAGTRLNESTVDLSEQEAKYEGSNSTPFREIRLQTQSAGAARQDVILSLMPAAAAAVSLVSVTQNRSTPPMILSGTSAWARIFPGATLQPMCTRFGFNVRPQPGPNPARVRIGGVGDNDPACNSPDSWVGVGGFVDNAACTPMGSTLSAGNVSGCDGAATSRRVAAFVWVWVR